jgi:hypothetical protein
MEVQDRFDQHRSATDLWLFVAAALLTIQPCGTWQKIPPECAKVRIPEGHVAPGIPYAVPFQETTVYPYEFSIAVDRHGTS